MKKHCVFLVAIAVLTGCNTGEQTGPPAAETQASGGGEPAPEMLAQGWLNGTPPNASDLAGKVVVVDVWAHW